MFTRRYFSKTVIVGGTAKYCVSRRLGVERGGSSDASNVSDASRVDTPARCDRAGSSLRLLRDRSHTSRDFLSFRGAAGDARRLQSDVSMKSAKLIWVFGMAGVLAHVACGGVESELDLESESEDALVDDVETASADEAFARDVDGALFESYASVQRFEPFLSRVRLIVAADCPDHITDELSVPLRCLDVRTGRHALIGDVDAVGAERTVRFHRLNNQFLDPPVASLDDCFPDRAPNRLADLHLAGARKYIAAGFFRAGGERRYEVVYRRVGDVYRLLPARPKLDGMIWSVMKPYSSACLRNE